HTSRRSPYSTLFRSHRIAPVVRLDRPARVAVSPPVAARLAGAGGLTKARGRIVRNTGSTVRPGNPGRTVDPVFRTIRPRAFVSPPAPAKRAATGGETATRAGRSSRTTGAIR